MASVSYEYTTLEFTRPPLEPLTEEEYRNIKKDFDNFFDDILDKAEAQFKTLKNPHRFKKTRFLILLATGILFLAIDYILKEMDHYDAGEIFAMLSFIPFFAIFIQPVQWLMSASKSSGFDSYRYHARKYYYFHRLKANVSSSYAEYLRFVSTATMQDYERFIWDA
jgi:hypothetical protein